TSQRRSSSSIATGNGRDSSAPTRAMRRWSTIGLGRSRDIMSFSASWRTEVVSGPAVKAPLLKRPFDVVLSGVGLIVSAPLWALIAGAIKLDDGGAVFFPQVRVGQGGRRFRSWKFRSMIEASDAQVGPLQARDRDPRITRVGRLLRATAMDELPQLWNIFRGDMSFVGPRALLPEEIEVSGDGARVPIEAIPGYEARHRVRPGLTGLAQVFAPRDIPRRHKFKL